MIPYDPRLKTLARDLRKNMTPQERKLWYEFLRDVRPRFYRQRPLKNFIVDFYCPSCKLAIEVDGSQHFAADGVEKDACRTAILKAQGVTVLRVSNLDVRQNFAAVCQEILAAVEHTDG